MKNIVKKYKYLLDGQVHYVTSNKEPHEIEFYLTKRNGAKEIKIKECKEFDEEKQN